MQVRLSSKGLLIIPKAIRNRLGWRAGTELQVEDRGDHLLLRPIHPLETTTVDDLIGCAGYEGPRKSLRQMEAGIARGKA